MAALTIITNPVITVCYNLTAICCNLSHSEVFITPLSLKRMCHHFDQLLQLAFLASGATRKYY